MNLILAGAPFLVGVLLATLGVLLVVLLWVLDTHARVGGFHRIDRHLPNGLDD